MHWIAAGVMTGCDPVQRIDPTDIAGINEQVRAWAASGERVWPVNIEHIIFGDDVIDTLADLTRHLPPDTPSVTPAQRREQIARRQAHIRRRWRQF